LSNTNEAADPPAMVYSGTCRIGGVKVDFTATFPAGATVGNVAGVASRKATMPDQETREMGTTYHEGESEAPPLGEDLSNEEQSG